MAEKLEDVHAVLIDLDGTIFVGDRLVPGAADSIENLRRGNIPMRFGTNISRMPRTAFVKHLSEMGLEVELEEVLTAPLAAASWLERKGLWNLALRVGTETHSDFAHFTINETSPQAVVIGDMGSDWDFNMLNTAFQQIMDGAVFVALHRNPHWDTGDGLAMDAGAFVTALEYATKKEAMTLGKPSRAFFMAAAESMGVELFNMAVIGDDMKTDIAGANACDAASVLVKTGKFTEDDLYSRNPKPDLILDSVASLPNALGVGFK